MNVKRQKGYWVKKAETFPNLAKARSRALELRGHEHVVHVKVKKQGQEYRVGYSVAKWYLEELDRAGVEL